MDEADKANASRSMAYTSVACRATAPVQHTLAHWKPLLPESTDLELMHLQF